MDRITALHNAARQYCMDRAAHWHRQYGLPEIVAVETNTLAGRDDSVEQHNICKLFELRESCEGFEVETAFAEFDYTGAEGFWTSPALDWLIYVSHASSITFGGEWLIESMRSLLSEFDRYIYKGWDLELYKPE